jgi:hypothetical protein
VTKKERELQPYLKEARVQEYQEKTHLQPLLNTEYQLSEAFEPAEAITTIVTGPKKPQGLPAWMTDKLPPGFPRHPPDLFGTIIQVQSQYEHPGASGGFGEFFGQMRDAVWSVPHQQANRERDDILVTTVRISTNSGRQEDIRLRGYLKKASILLGDSVSLWGKKRSGLFVVHRAYNHTSKGPITTSSMDSPLSFLLWLLIMILIFFILVYTMHINVPFLPKFFNN